jgi:hypothetical protein
VLLSVMAQLHHAVVVAREPLAGHMRLAWWRDQCMVLPQATGHPLFALLRKISLQHNITEQHLVAMVEGFSALLETQEVADTSELLTLGGKLYAPLYRIMCPKVPDSLIVKFAQCDGVVMLLQHVPFWLGHQKSWVAASVLESCGESTARLLAGNVAREQLRPLSRSVWEQVQVSFPEPPTSAYPVFLMVLYRLLRILVNYNVKNPDALWLQDKNSLYAKLPLKMAFASFFFT